MTVIFALLGSTRVKAVRKMLVKLTPGRDFVARIDLRRSRHVPSRASRRLRDPSHRGSGRRLGRGRLRDLRQADDREPQFAQVLQFKPIADPIRLFYFTNEEFFHFLLVK